MFSPYSVSLCWSMQLRAARWSTHDFAARAIASDQTSGSAQCFARRRLCASSTACISGGGAAAIAAADAVGVGAGALGSTGGASRVTHAPRKTIRTRFKSRSERALGERLSVVRAAHAEMDVARDVERHVLVE